MNSDNLIGLPTPRKATGDALAILPQGPPRRQLREEMVADLKRVVARFRSGRLLIFGCRGYQFVLFVQ